MARVSYGSHSRPRVLAAALVTLTALAALTGCDDKDVAGPAAAGRATGPRTTAPPTAGERTAGPGTAGPATASTPPPSAPAEPSVRAGHQEPPAGDGPLRGRTVVLDPGHNIRNQDHSAEINRSVDIGTGRKECDTTGTSTNSGYAEAEFSLDMAHRVRDILAAQGARVVLTHDGDRPYGPCVDERAAIGNAAHADAALSVHADGAAEGQRGFHVILPAKVKGGRADTGPIVGPSRELGERVAGTFVRETGSAPSNYIGHGTGLDVRGDLGGLNLSTVPKVFVECGNMRDAQDAARLTDPAWRARAAQGIAQGIADFVRGR
ncbi:N-acetylmuramoyl-L-alanine amidase [Streptomyces caatingaensis]|uniref:N-acetylmuramoyl-L-alanine amidase n=1 Tax=Streptomyces caatingaensis TaxID=1678637 RepID=A0A0K9XHM2_9ACTN|nr:N-acetylmuramoyl-L-alanine amidase [Streptomyces caatingaensis]